MTYVAVVWQQFYTKNGEMNYFSLLKNQMCSVIPDDTSVCGVVSYPIVRKCWCRRDFISDRQKSHSAHEVSEFI